ncbi:MAG: glycosyltransferase family 2 protein [Sphingomonadaceae bacterium]|nr:glycosyltransferase family 2 protein [Sphingomonadaceae bacterium]
MARISIILPCHNGAAFIADALDSVLDQSRPADEIIVVDDGSADASAEICLSYGSRIRLIRQSRQGAGAARNVGVWASSGDIIGFLDADDSWPPDSVAMRLGQMAATGADIVFGQVRQCRDKVGVAAPRIGPDMAGRLAGTMLVRRAIFEHVGGFDPSLPSGEVIEWTARAADAGAVMADCDALTLYRRVHGGNMMLHRPDASGEALTMLRQTLARRRASSAA